MGQRSESVRLTAAEGRPSVWPSGQAYAKGKARRRRLTPFYFAGPAVIFVFVGSIFMALYALYISFFDYQLQRPGAPRFVGLKNYAEAFTDAKLWTSIWQTFTIAVPALALEIVFGLALAMLLNRSFRGRAIAISLIVTPVMVSSAAAGMAWRLLLEPRYGPVNDILSRLSGQPVQIGWLSSVEWARPAIVLTDVWHMTPFVMLLVLAGLGSISDDIYGAAKIDGASGWRLFVDITLPLLKPILVLVILLRGIDLVRIFDLIFIMTKGGPGTITKTVSYYIYENGLSFFRIGYASAMAWIVAIFFIIFSKFYLDYLRKESR
ncbi:MAG: sugar ABC transporter permease [Thermomicrobiales bacterium]|nr:sugar ABC transporter permease [Thermomicrobiales bacterium]